MKYGYMSQEQRQAWGDTELKQRLRDIRVARELGEMTAPGKLAIERRNAIGASANQAAQMMADAMEAKRRKPFQLACAVAAKLDLGMADHKGKGNG